MSFLNSVDEFIKFAEVQDPIYGNTKKIMCLFFNCKNKKFLLDGEVALHLHWRDFIENYFN